MKSNRIPVLEDSDGKNKSKLRYLFYIAIPVVLILIAALSIYLYYIPSTDYSIKQDQRVVLNDIPFENENVIEKDNRVFLSFHSIQEMLDSSIFWDEYSNKVIITTSDKVIDMDYYVISTAINYKPIDIDTPFLMENEIPYIDLEFISPLYNLDVATLDSNVTVIDNFESSVMIVKSTKSKLQTASLISLIDNTLSDEIHIRKEPSFRSLRVESIGTDEKLNVYKEESGWYKVRTASGIIGYINKNNTQLFEIIEKQREEKFFSPPWRPVGEKINMTWDYMSFSRQDMSEYESVPGLNVISPTWFHLENANGDIINHGTNAYVEWAHSQGLQVWALFSNNFDPDLTSKVLRDFETRKKVITQIMVLAELLDIDGINIDFENMYYADKDYFTQFVRELTPFMHEMGITVSIDVTIISSSEMWSMVYDRYELGKVVDYMAIMTYDEHWAASPLAGSVASIPWVENGLKGVLELVPSHKILLGVPFYTRLWPVESLDNNQRTDLSITYSMNGVNNLIEEKNLTVTYDENAGQNYVEFIEDGQAFMLWIEDEVSMKQRIALIHEYKLAGVASWRKGFELPHIWETLNEELN